MAARLVPGPVRDPLGEELHGHVLEHARVRPEARGPGVGQRAHPQRARGAGRRYPESGANPRTPGVIEGDSPSFLHLAGAVRGRNDPEQPDQAGWGGRFVRRTPPGITGSMTRPAGRPSGAGGPRSSRTSPAVRTGCWTLDADDLGAGRRFRPLTLSGIGFSSFLRIASLRCRIMLGSSLPQAQRPSPAG